MKLNEYLSAYRGRVASLAKALGIAQPYLSQLRSEIKKPSFGLAIKIETFTNGEVGINDLRPDLAEALKNAGYVKQGQSCAEAKGVNHEPSCK